MPTDGERLATLETQIRELRDDIADRKREEERTRDRLHKVEGTMQMLVDVQKAARESELRQYRRVEVRLQVLTGAVTFAAFMLSLTIWLVHH